MNQQRENNTASAEYRATATERVPPEIDAIVLEQAKMAVRRSGLQGFTAYWFRPLAFVATLLLSLALVLELTRPPEVQPARSDAVPAQPALPGGTAERADAPTRDSVESGDFAQMIENSAKRMQAMDPATQSAVSELQQSREADRDPESVEALGASGAVPDARERYCPEEQTSDALKWWRCISELSKTGKHDQARAELMLFDAAHPDFEPPGAR